MIPKDLKTELANRIQNTAHPRELAVDVMNAIQGVYGWLTDDGLVEAAALLQMDPLELEELATFYNFIYRQPVGRYVIHVCDSVICWMDGYVAVADYLCRKLGIRPGETSADGLFTVLPTCCLGYCDYSPACLINRRVYGHLTTDKIDSIIETLRNEAEEEQGGV